MQRVVNPVTQMLRRADWYGVKPGLAKIIRLPIINLPLRKAAALVLPQDTLVRLPVSSSSAEYRLQSGDAVILSDPHADQLAKNLVWGGGRPTSPAEASILRFVEQRSAAIDLFLDIGAYSCLFSLIAVKANPSARAVAFEVLPQNFQLCWKNVIRNDVVRRLDVRLCGVGASKSSIRMPLNTGSASNPSSVSLAAEFQAGAEIPVVDLNSLAFDGRMLWKIDVEGFEWDVFRGARETIQRNRPDIICEILSSFPHAAEVQGLLQPLGYKFFVATSFGIEERSEIIPTKDGRDWIFTTKAPGDPS